MPNLKWWFVLSLLVPGCTPQGEDRVAHAPPARLGRDGLSRTSIRHEIWVQPTEQPGAYRIRLRREFNYRVLSRRELDSPAFFVYESPLAPVKRLQAFMNGRLLSKKHIKRENVRKRHVFIDDAKVHRIRYPVSHLGTTIGYRYELAFDDPALLPPALVPGMDHVRRFELIVHHPSTMRVDFRVWRPYSKPAPVVYRSGDKSRWVLENEYRRPVLPYYPYNGLAALVLPVLISRSGPLQPITPVAHARWYRSLFRKERPLSAAHRALVRRLIAKATSPMEKVRALHEFVRQKVRYIAVAKGMGRLVPSAADTVLGRRWGDCKDMANLLRVLGKEVGVKIDLVLVGVRERPSLGGAVHTFQYDHLIASYHDGNRRLFFDPTASSVPFGQLPEADIGKQALVINGSETVALRLPAPVQDPTLEMNIHAHVGRLHRARVRIIVRNGLLSVVRRVLRTLHGTPQQTRLRRLLESPVEGLVLRRIRVLGLRKDTALFHGEADLSGFVVKTMRGLYLPRVPFDPYHDLLQVRTRDTLPVMLGGRPHLRLTLRLATPGYTVPKVPAQTLRSNGVADYGTRLQITPQGLLVTYQLRQWRKRFTGDKREQMLEFHRRFGLAQRRWYRLKRSGP